MNKYSRRAFMIQTSTALAAAISPPPMSMANAAAKSQRKASPARIGIQLWAVKDALRTDPAGTLAALKQIGYEEVEATTLNMSAKELRQAFDSAGLVCPSAHLNFFKLDKLDATLEEGHTLGAHYVVSSVLSLGTGSPPTLPPGMHSPASALRAMTIDDAKRAAEKANKIGERAKQAGLQYAYHNHFFEFVPQPDGRVAYDVLLSETDPELVKFELDCGWAMVSGYDPIDYFKRHPGRFPLIHAKDFAAADSATAGFSPAVRKGVELGDGSIDYKPILVAAKAAGVEHYLVEQEEPFERMTQLEAAKVNYTYLRALV